MNSSFIDTAQVTCDVLLSTTGIPGQVWSVLAFSAIVVGAIGLVAAQRLMAEGKRRRIAARSL